MEPLKGSAEGQARGGAGNNGDGEVEGSHLRWIRKCSRGFSSVLSLGPGSVRDAERVSNLD